MLVRYRWRFVAILLLSLMCHAELANVARAKVLFVANDIYAPFNTGDQTSAELADQRYELARQACQAGDVALALQLATQAVVADPNHMDARRVLGYRRFGDHWAGSYAARRLDREEIWDPKFGWIKKADLPRFEAGERPLGSKRWISVDEDARRHDTVDEGWRIRTDHFRVTTNHSRQEAARMAAELEALYQIWQQLFGDFALKPSDLLKRFDGKAISGYRSKPFEVNYYRTREEYNTALIRQQPRIGMTLGIYFDTTRKAHFFAGEEQDAGTIYHEAVHQLFHESGKSARRVGALSNAWLTEGVACYFESLVKQRDPQGRIAFTIGMPAAGRLPAARHRRLVDDYYVPLAELSALGLKDFQARTDLPRLYSQSAGLVTFLMQYQDGVYRPALVKTLQLLYAGRDQPSTLVDLTGRAFEELDLEYRRYLESLPTAAAASP